MKSRSLTIGIGSAALVALSWWALSGEDRARPELLSPGAGPSPTRAEDALTAPASGELSQLVIAQTVAEAPAQGRLAFLYLRSGAPCEGGDWRVRRPGQPSDAARSVRGAEVSLEPGVWIVESAVPDLATPSDGAVSVVADNVTAVWVVEPGSVEFTLVDPDGSPIEGGRGIWSPPIGLDPERWKELWPSPLHDPSSDRSADGWPDVTSSRSDATGRLEFEGLTDRTLGDVRFCADEYFPAELWLRGDLMDAMRTVELRPTGRRARTLRVVELSTEQPLEGVVLTTAHGEVHVGVTDAEGSMILPTWIDESEPLRADGACFPWTFTVPGGELPARVPASARGTLVVAGATTPEIALEAVAGTGAGEAPRELLTKSLVAGRCQVAVPAGVHFTLAVADGHGHHGQVERSVSVGGWEAEVFLGDENTLAIEVERPGEVRALVSYESPRPRKTYRSGTNGRIHVPLADEARSIRLEAPARATVILKAHGTGSRAGEIAVDLPDTHLVPLQLVDARDATRAIRCRMVIRLSSTAPSRLDEFPDRAGGTPSGHPGWSLGIPPVPNATTDGFGRAEVRLTEGEYVANFTDLESWRTGRLPWSFHSSSRRTFFAPTEDTVTIPTHDSRFVAVEVRSAESGRAVDAFDLGPAGNFAASASIRYQHVTIDGASWQGWISTAVDALSIGTLQSGFQTVSVPDEDWVELTVDLVGSEPMTFFLDESCSDLEGAEIDFFCTQESGIVDFQGRAVVRNGRLDVFAPPGHSAYVILEPTERTIAIAPDRHPWVPGTEVSLRCEQRR